MNKYICTKCGKACYSAAELEYLYNDKCPYCGGKIRYETNDIQNPDKVLVVISTLTEVPWNETESQWFVTDDDTFQCCKVVHLDERIYELIQINPYILEGMEPFYTVSCGLISLKRYSDEDILKYMQPYGFNSMEQFIKEHDGILYWQYIAEMIFETTCPEYEACQRYHSFEAAAGIIKTITGLPIPGMEEKSQIVPSKQ